MKNIHWFFLFVRTRCNRWCIIKQFQESNLNDYLWSKAEINKLQPKATIRRVSQGWWTKEKIDGILCKPRAEKDIEDTRNTKLNDLENVYIRYETVEFRMGGGSAIPETAEENSR